MSMMLEQSLQVISRFTCEGCGKQYRWQSHLAGRRVRCAKCHHVMIAPEFLPSEELDNGLYELVPDSPPPRKRENYDAFDVSAVVATTTLNAPVQPARSKRTWFVPTTLLVLAILVSGVIYRIVV